MENNHRKNLFLMDCWNTSIYQQILEPELAREEDNEATSYELTVSKIGHFAWENRTSFSMISMTTEDENNDLSSNLASDKRERRPRASGVIVKSLFKEIISTSDPHLLIPPFKFGEPGLLETEKQPFRVLLHPQVPLICDVHAHLSDAEVIGFLAGRWDGASRILYIQAAIPCSSTSRDEDDGATDVELDPEAEFLAREIITSLNLQVVGWYHSHPKFRADPSLIDCQNQQQYQNFMKDEATGLEPFVGLIISTYDKQLADGKSFHRWFAVREYCDEKNITVSMPIEIDVEFLQYVINEEECRKNNEIVISEEKIMLLRCSNDELIDPKTNTVSNEIEGSTEEPEVSPIKGLMEDQKVNVVEEDLEGTIEDRESLPLPIPDLPKPVDQRYSYEDTSTSVTSQTSSIKDSSTIENPLDQDNSKGVATIKEEYETLNQVPDESMTNPSISTKSVDLKEELPIEDTTGVRRSRRQPKPNGFYKEREETEFREKLKPSKVKVTQAVKSPEPEKKKGGRKRKLENEQILEETGSNTKQKKKPKSEPTSSSSSATTIPTTRGKRKVELSHPSRTILDSFVLTLQDPKLLSSALARKIVVSTPFYLRFITICFLSVGFHFSRYYRRTELLQAWKSQIKLDKLAISVNRWAEYFLVEGENKIEGKAVNPQIIELLNNLFAFLKSCWEEYSAKSGKVKLLR